jgi:hypothetical protein
MVCVDQFNLVCALVIDVSLFERRGFGDWDSILLFLQKGLRPCDDSESRIHRQRGPVCPERVCSRFQSRMQRQGNLSVNPSVPSLSYLRMQPSGRSSAKTKLTVTFMMMLQIGRQVELDGTQVESLRTHHTISDGTKVSALCTLLALIVVLIYHVFFFFFLSTQHTYGSVLKFYIGV